MKQIIAVLLTIFQLISPASMIAETEAEPVCITSTVSVESQAPVAKMYICTRTKIAGHVWLYFENLTDETIRVGCYDLPADQGVTVSAYNTSRRDGKGNYYNIDGYCLNKYGSSATTCASVEITASQLEEVSAKIVSRNTWSGTKNCCYFAATIWNSVSPNKLKIVLLPSLMGIYIKKIGCAKPDFYFPEKDQCFKQVGTGDAAYLSPCSSGSFNRLVG